MVVLLASIPPFRAAQLWKPSQPPSLGAPEVLTVVGIRTLCPALEMALILAGSVSRLTATASCGAGDVEVRFVSPVATAQETAAVTAVVKTMPGAVRRRFHMDSPCEL